MNENLKLFLKKLSEDAELQQKLQRAGNPDEAFAIASAAQDGFTKDEFVETMQCIRDQMGGDELTDADLASFAGGMDEETEEALIKMGLAIGSLAITGGAITAAVFAA